MLIMKMVLWSNNKKINIKFRAKWEIEFKLLFEKGWNLVKYEIWTLKCVWDDGSELRWNKLNDQVKMAAWCIYSRKKLLSSHFIYAAWSFKFCSSTWLLTETKVAVQSIYYGFDFWRVNNTKIWCLKASNKSM